MTYAEQQVAARAHHARVCDANERFARLNGWRCSDRGFTMRRLARTRGPRHLLGDDPFPLMRYGSDDMGRVMDHLFWFNCERTAVAVITMPYEAKLDDVLAVASQGSARSSRPRPWSPIGLCSRLAPTLRERRCSASSVAPELGDED
jgi:hypothetical protein